MKDAWTRIVAVKADARAEGEPIDTEREKNGIRPLSRRKKCMPPAEKKNKLIGRQLLRSRVDNHAAKRSFDTA
jgi:hypothetical protein